MLQTLVRPGYNRNWARLPIDHKDPSLVLYLPLWYPHSDMTGSNVYSYDRNRHIGAVTGATWGKYGRTYNGTSDKIIVPHHASLSFSGSFYLAAWVKFGTLTDYHIIISKLTSGKYNYSLYLDTTNPRIGLELYDGTNNPVAYSVNNSIANTSTFYFVEGIVEAGGNVQTFVNLVGGTAVSNSIVDSTNTANIGIGHRILSVATYANAVIGDVWLRSAIPSLSERTNTYLRTKWRYSS